MATEYGILRAGTRASAGQATLKLSDDSYLIEEVTIQNQAGGATVSIGNDLLCPFELAAGATVTLHIDRLDKIYVRFPAAGGRVNWLAGSK